MQLNYERLLAELLARPEKLIQLQPRDYEGLLGALLTKLKIEYNIRRRVIALLKALNNRPNTVKSREPMNNLMAHNLSTWLEQLDLREPRHLLKDITAVYCNVEYKRRLIVCLFNAYSSLS